MKFLGIILVLFFATSAMAIDIDFANQTGTEIQSASVQAVSANCPRLMEDGKLLRYLSHQVEQDGDSEFIQVRLFGWRNNGLTGMLTLTFGEAGDHLELLDFYTMPSSICF